MLAFDDIKKLTEYILYNIYAGNFKGILEYAHPHITLIGSSKTQRLYSKRDIECYLTQFKMQEQSPVLFDMKVVWEDENASLATGKIILRTDNSVSNNYLIQKRYSIFWVKNNSKFQVLHLHISIPEDSTTTIAGYKDLGLRTYDRYKLLSQTPYSAGSCFSIKTIDSVYYQFSPHEIICIAASNKHSIYHTTGGTLTVKQKLSDIKLTPNFISPHRSYIINTDYIESIEKYQINLCDYISIPIPSKKYQEIRNLLISKTSFKEL